MERVIAAIGFAICVAVLLLNGTGCAMRVSVTPIQQEEFTQKTVTNQFFDWLFKESPDVK